MANFYNSTLILKRIFNHYIYTMDIVANNIKYIREEKNLKQIEGLHYERVHNILSF